MANKRSLKRKINYVCSDLFAECIAETLYNGLKENENTNALLTSILVIHNDFIRRISHPEPGMTANAYYHSLLKDFDKNVSEIIDQISNLH